MTRRWPRESAPLADVRFRVGERIEDGVVGELEHFLCSRWALVTKRRNRLLYGKVHHPRWPLHRVEDPEIDQTIIEAAGLPSPNGAPHALYSPGVGVAWFQTAPKEAQ
ncbi:MAG: hypothetical protein ACI88C_000718 [Acidimicrobiales bacterium]|jgi:uncharacterized protein YqjF (DUF2071 family)